MKEIKKTKNKQTICKEKSKSELNGIKKKINQDMRNEKHETRKRNMTKKGLGVAGKTIGE